MKALKIAGILMLAAAAAAAASIGLVWFVYAPVLSAALERTAE